MYMSNRNITSSETRARFPTNLRYTIPLLAAIAGIDRTYPYGNTAHAYDLLKDHVAYPQGGYLRGQVILPGSFLDAMDAHLNISLIYGLEDMKDINEWSITPCLLYVKGDTY